MTDPFTALRAVAPSVAPDPAFARALRARLERALRLPRGVVPVTDPTDSPAVTPAVSPAVTAAVTPVEPPRPAAVPYLAVADARAAIDWYVDVFGAAVVGEPIVIISGDGAATITQRIAMGKAQWSIQTKGPSAAGATANPALVGELGVARPGAIPIMAGSDLVGAIAASGSPSGQADEVCVKAGLAKIQDRVK